MEKQTVSIKVGCKTYNVSNSWNSLFLCGEEELRTLTAFSVFGQLRADKYRDVVDVKMISHDPQKYEDDIAVAFDADLIEKYLEDMGHRYDLIADSESRNYIQHNRKNIGEKIKLSVLIVDGLETVVANPKYAQFLENLRTLTQKSRASGIHVITFIDKLPEGKEDFFKYYGTPAHVMRKGFFMKDATNTIIKELYTLGFSPIINVSYDNEKETIWIGINVEVNDVHLSFSFDFDGHSVNYALLFPFDSELDFDTHMEIFRMLRTDISHCYDGFSDDYYEGHLAITGSRWSSQITPLFVQFMIEEISSLKLVKKLKTLQKREFVFQSNTNNVANKRIFVDAKGDLMMEYTERQEMLYKEGLKLLRENGTASCVLFQIKLSIGYVDARFIYDRMIAEGVAVEYKQYSIKPSEKENGDEI